MVFATKLKKSPKIVRMMSIQICHNFFKFMVQIKILSKFKKNLQIKLIKSKTLLITPIIIRKLKAQKK